MQAGRNGRTSGKVACQPERSPGQDGAIAPDQNRSRQPGAVGRWPRPAHSRRRRPASVRSASSSAARRTRPGRIPRSSDPARESASDDRSSPPVRADSARVGEARSAAGQRGPARRESLAPARRLPGRRGRLPPRRSFRPSVSPCIAGHSWTRFVTPRSDPSRCKSKDGAECLAVEELLTVLRAPCPDREHRGPVGAKRRRDSRAPAPTEARGVAGTRGCQTMRDRSTVAPQGPTCSPEA